MDKLVNIGDRISAKDHDTYTTVLISNTVDRWKVGLLLCWVILWTVCGALMVYSLLVRDASQENTLGLAVFLSFWLFFEIRIGKALLWRLKGMEFLKIDRDKLILKKAIGTYGKAQEFLIGNVKNIERIDCPKRSWTAVVESSFWFVGGETIEFDCSGKKVRFAYQLSDKDSKDLTALIKSKIRYYVSA